MEERPSKLLAYLVFTPVFIIGAGVLALVNYGIWFMAYDPWVHRDIATWQTAEGELKRLDAAYMGYSSRTLQSQKYSVTCQYAYTVGGREYTGDSFVYPYRGYPGIDTAKQVVEQGLGLVHARWQDERWPLGGGHATLDAQGVKVKVLYKPSDPSVSTLVKDFDGPGNNPPEGWYAWRVVAAALYALLALLLDAGAGLAAGILVYQRLHPDTPPREDGPLAPAEACDAFIPLLDEGIAALEGLRPSWKKDQLADLDWQINDFRGMKEQAAARRLRMSKTRLGLDRKYEWDGDDPAVRRFKRAMDAIDAFHDDRLMLPRKG